MIIVREINTQHDSKFNPLPSLTQRLQIRNIMNLSLNGVSFKS